MSRRALLFSLFLVLALPLAAQKRRAVLPGDEGRCQYGTLADLADPVLLAIDATHVYFVDDFLGSLSRVPKDGGPVEPLLELSFDTLPFAMAVDSTDVYLALIPFSEDGDLLPGSIAAVPKGGGIARNIATAVIFPVEVASDESHVYWVSAGTIDFFSGRAESDGKIERARKDGTGRQALAEGLSVPFSLVLDGADVYFSELGEGVGNPSAGVRRVPKAGGIVSQLTQGFIAADLQQTVSEIVFLGAPRAADEDVGIYAVSKSGGNVRTIVVEPDLVAGPRVSGGFVYYTKLGEDESQDDLYRVPVGGGQPVFLRTAYMGYPDFEVDDCAVYYGYYIELQLVAVPR